MFGSFIGCELSGLNWQSCHIQNISLDDTAPHCDLSLGTTHSQLAEGPHFCFWMLVMSREGDNGGDALCVGDSWGDKHHWLVAMHIALETGLEPAISSLGGRRLIH